jgi:hypothetical protein
VQATAINSDDNIAYDMWVQVKSFTTSYVNIKPAYANTTGAIEKINGFYWFAIGY